MPAFLNRVFKRDANAKRPQNQVPVPDQPSAPKWTDGWLRTEVSPDEVQELLRVCTAEVKSRGACIELNKFPPPFPDKRNWKIGNSPPPQKKRCGGFRCRKEVKS